MNNQELKKLIEEYQLGNISLEQLHVLKSYITDLNYEHDIDNILKELIENPPKLNHIDISSEKMYQRIISSEEFLSKAEKNNYRLYKIVATVAAVFLLVVGGIYYINLISTDTRHSSSDITYTAKTTTNSPTDKLLLKTSDGHIIDLDNLQANQIDDLEFINVESNNGLQYRSASKAVNAQKHTLIVPKGRVYNITMSDGTKVWLNSASSITFPASFDKISREVKIDGEAYFEVNKASDWPFVVHANEQKIEVLGTHFNINSYKEDAQTRTTLLEGKVRVSNGTTSVMIKPGQQAFNSSKSKKIGVQNVDIHDAIAWRESLFVFNDDEIQSVMKKISRWYDVDILYMNGVEGKRIGGSVSRYSSIKELMDALQATGVLHYDLKGGTVIIKE